MDAASEKVWTIERYLGKADDRSSWIVESVKLRPDTHDGLHGTISNLFGLYTPVLWISPFSGGKQRLSRNIFMTTGINPGLPPAHFLVESYPEVTATG
jgi:hypothetical protein